MSSVYDRLAVLERFPGLDAMGHVRDEGRQLERLGGIADRAEARAVNTVDHSRVRAASIIAQFAAMPEADRAEMLRFCERLVSECGNRGFGK